MEFLDLYNLASDILASRQKAGKDVVIVPIRELKPKLIEQVSWLADINFHPVVTEEGDPLGHYECHSEAESRWDDPDAWVVLITYSELLNDCQRRFVWCKELMHIFDTENGSTKTEEEYRGLLQEIELRPIEPSEQYLSENQAKWMALLILCPKEHRDHFKARFDDGELTDYDVAIQLRIPQPIVRSLFSEYYDKYYETFVVEARNKRNG